ncbi:OsmC family peroxiredoxin [Corallococcus sp. H22C18031201]|uniref:OsmC family protein n=1 Tax=Citreicoccus inhibens TaxID=2849499 RepID=UPI000E70E60B|nr:OsmC family protein [Citreicoccus inhibens]MBU8898504.1 OsmC family protein [Citreicoccus inhibens]RJS21345.1 OsmC family peroxiredoxin [Corallococcus sp. H22C18031201]
MAHTHRYEVECRWEGSTGVGYESYDRSHVARAIPAAASLELSSDPTFRGNPARTNPEQLLVLAASSCQLLSFLAIAARARFNVVRYEDRAEAVMPEDDKPIRITSIVLRPRIYLAKGPSEERVRALIEQAHRECYIANSVRTDIRVEPELHFVD